MSKSIPTLPQFGPITDTGEEPSLEQIDSANQEVRSQVDKVLNELTEDDLNLTFPMPLHEHPVSIRNTPWHLVEEELQHRGELNALLWQMNVDPPILDWIEWTDSISHSQAGGDKRS